MVRLYAKTTEDVSGFDPVLDRIRKENEEVTVTVEAKRAFWFYEELKKKTKAEDIFIVLSQGSLGLNEADIANELEFFIEHDFLLVICDVPSTYEYGVREPMNKAVLSTLLSAILNENRNVVQLPKRSNSGRNKIKFPDGWDELYKQWEEKTITSAEFYEKAGP